MRYPVSRPFLLNQSLTSLLLSESTRAISSCVLLKVHFRGALYVPERLFQGSLVGRQSPIFPAAQQGLRQFSVREALQPISRFRFSNPWLRCARNRFEEMVECKVVQASADVAALRGSSFRARTVPQTFSHSCCKSTGRASATQPTTGQQDSLATRPLPSRETANTSVFSRRPGILLTGDCRWR
jgi:hypothetical protein